MNTENARNGKFNVFVKTNTSGAVELRVNCQFQQTLSFGDAVSNRACISTGNLEQMINDSVAQKLHG